MEEKSKIKKMPIEKEFLAAIMRNTKYAVRISYMGLLIALLIANFIFWGIAGDKVEQNVSKSEKNSYSSSYRLLHGMPVESAEDKDYEVTKSQIYFLSWLGVWYLVAPILIIDGFAIWMTILMVRNGKKSKELEKEFLK